MESIPGVLPPAAGVALLGVPPPAALAPSPPVAAAAATAAAATAPAPAAAKPPVGQPNAAVAAPAPAASPRGTKRARDTAADDAIATRIRSMMQDDPSPRVGPFGTGRFRDTSRSQYNHALKHFIPFVQQGETDVEAMITFLDGDGRIRDEIFLKFAAYLNARDTMTESVFKNCVKWMQKNLEWQCEKKQLPSPKAYVTRLPGMKDICAGQKDKQRARDAINDAKDAALLARMDPTRRHAAAAEAYPRFTI